jgi:hypothetical protein
MSFHRSFSLRVAAAGGGLLGQADLGFGPANVDAAGFDH